MQSRNQQSSKVRVVVRVRPMMAQDDQPWVQVLNDHTLQTLNHRNTEEALHYEFSSVFDADCSQKNVYEDCVKPQLGEVISGRNASVFAYGPTGAGKTHTILGTPEDPGIIPRCIKDIFAAIDEEKSNDTEGHWTFKVSFSYLEIYNEKVLDLLEQKDRDLPIREDGHKNIFVANLAEKSVNDVQEFNTYFGPASKNRTMASTKLNERSSRSHSILLLKVQCLQKVSPFCRRTGKIHIIDLAGSENNRRTGNIGVRLKESGAINSSLLALGQVVEALNKGQACVPYRGSKLTRFLQDSLGGNALTCMIVNLAPEEQNYFDTYTTLHFARKTKKIVNTVRVNESFEKPAVIKVVTKRSIESDENDKDGPPAKKKSSPKPDITEGAPFLSPLLRSQERFRSVLRDEMMETLHLLEERLLKQITETGTNPLRPKSCQDDPDSTTDISKPEKKQKKTSSSRKRGAFQDLKQFGEQLENMKRSARKITKRGETVFADGSVKENLKQTAEISCSPLFINAPTVRRKGFKSTASKNTQNIDADCSPEGLVTTDAQQAHNDRVLMILNEGSIKQLQGLQTLGPKRAQLIHDWRNLQGPFTSFEDLDGVEGLSQRFVTTFLKKFNPGLGAVRIIRHAGDDGNSD